MIAACPLRLARWLVSSIRMPFLRGCARGDVPARIDQLQPAAGAMPSCCSAMRFA